MCSTKFTAWFVCVLCWLAIAVSARITQPSYGVPSYQPYQLQQHQQEFNHEADPDPPAQQLQQAGANTYKHHNKGAKHSVGNYHTHSRHSAEETHDDHHSHPKYKFSYHVEEHKTGDYKRHQEERDGDEVHGEYSLIEADGSMRTVKYTVDKEHGFQAIVVKEDGKRSRK